MKKMKLKSWVKDLFIILAIAVLLLSVLNLFAEKNKQIEEGNVVLINQNECDK